MYELADGMRLLARKTTHQLVFHAYQLPANPHLTSYRPLITIDDRKVVQGDTRDIVVIGERLHDDSGEVIGAHGFYIDVYVQMQYMQQRSTQPSPILPYIEPLSSKPRVS